jgi:prevent-host-death family protein
MKTARSQDVAKAFGKYQDQALAAEAVTVTRYGRPTVVILSYAEYERLRAGSGRRREVRRAPDMPDDLVAALDDVITGARQRLADGGPDGRPA